MDYQQSHAAFVAKRAENLNLDRLLSVFVVESNVTELRRNLMDIYFHSVNALTSDGAGAGTFGDALVTLQNIIEAVDAMTDNGKKHLGVKPL